MTEEREARDVDAALPATEQDAGRVIAVSQPQKLFPNLWRSCSFSHAAKFFRGKPVCSGSFHALRQNAHNPRLLEPNPLGKNRFRSSVHIGVNCLNVDRLASFFAHMPKGGGANRQSR